jgi:hypothetical protein
MFWSAKDPPDFLKDDKVLDNIHPKNTEMVQKSFEQIFPSLNRCVAGVKNAFIVSFPASCRNAGDANTTR